jgi:hypothetical protein
VYLLLKANHRANRFLFNKNEILIGRGQLLTGTRKIVKETGISRSKVRDRVKLLENLSIITQETTRQFSVITICNYNYYQGPEYKDPPNKPPTHLAGDNYSHEFWGGGSATAH